MLAKSHAILQLSFYVLRYLFVDLAVVVLMVFTVFLVVVVVIVWFSCAFYKHFFIALQLLINIFPLLKAISRLFLFSMNEMLLLFCVHVARRNRIERNEKTRNEK